MVVNLFVYVFSLQRLLRKSKIKHVYSTKSMLDKNRVLNFYTKAGVFKISCYLLRCLNVTQLFKSITLHLFSYNSENPLLSFILVAWQQHYMKSDLSCYHKFILCEVVVVSMYYNVLNRFILFKQDNTEQEDLTLCVYHETRNKLHLYINPWQVMNLLNTL